MSGKQIKQEVHSARTLLDATLQCLVDRKDDSFYQSDPESSVSMPEFRVPAPGLSPALSPSKRLPYKGSRKRKRKDDQDLYAGAGDETVIMKLFDRSVDLAQFPEDTPLYPVCRAWIQNRPLDKALGTLHRPPSPPPLKVEKDEETADGQPIIHQLPDPIKSESGCLYDLRVPEPVAQPEQTLDIHQAASEAPAAEVLLLNHMARWKEVRTHWREACVHHELQFAASTTTLKAMFDRAMANMADAQANMQS